MKTNEDEITIEEKNTQLVQLCQYLIRTSLLNQYKVELILDRLLNSIFLYLKENKTNDDNRTVLVSSLKQCCDLIDIYYYQNIFGMLIKDDKDYHSNLTNLCRKIQNYDTKEIINELKKFYPINDDLSELLKELNIDVFKTQLKESENVKEK